MRNQFLAAMALLALAGAGKAQADPITFTESATMSGSLDGTGFSGKLVTFAATLDTSAVAAYSSAGQTGYIAAAGTTTVTVAGVGSDTLTDHILVIDTQTGPGAPSFSLYDYTTMIAAGHTLLGTDDHYFATYGMTTGFTPIADTAYGTTGGSASYGTSSGGSGGTISFTTISSQSTASAALGSSPASVPEPSSIVLTGLAGVFALGLHRARARLAAKRS